MLGQNAFWPPTLIPQNGLPVPGKPCLEVSGVGGRLPHLWRMDPSFLKSHLLGMYLPAPKVKGWSAGGGAVVLGDLALSPVSRLINPALTSLAPNSSFLDEVTLPLALFLVGHLPGS